MEKSFKKLTDLNKKFREECVWHREQTLHSFAHKLKEEAGEVLEALEDNDADQLKEELGDLLWDVLFMIRLAEDKKLFDAKSLFDETHEKMIRRNPHLYEKKTDDMDEIWKMYYEVKAKDKEAKANRKKRPIGEEK